MVIGPAEDGRHGSVFLIQRLLLHPELANPRSSCIFKRNSCLYGSIKSRLLFSFSFLTAMQAREYLSNLDDPSDSVFVFAKMFLTYTNPN
jgi:hypothetical protein